MNHFFGWHRRGSKYMRTIPAVHDRLWWRSILTITLNWCINLLKCAFVQPIFVSWLPFESHHEAILKRFFYMWHSLYWSESECWSNSVWMGLRGRDEGISLFISWRRFRSRREFSSSGFPPQGRLWPTPHKKCKRISEIERNANRRSMIDRWDRLQSNAINLPGSTRPRTKLIVVVREIVATFSFNLKRVVKMMLSRRFSVVCIIISVLEWVKIASDRNTNTNTNNNLSRSFSILRKWENFIFKK